MYFTLVFLVILCQDIGSVDLRQILKFVIPQIKVFFFYKLDIMLEMLELPLIYFTLQSATNFFESALDITNASLFNSKW